MLFQPQPFLNNLKNGVGLSKVPTDLSNVVLHLQLRPTPSSHVGTVQDSSKNNNGEKLFTVPIFEGGSVFSIGSGSGVKSKRKFIRKARPERGGCVAQPRQVQLMTHNLFVASPVAMDE